MLAYAMAGRVTAAAIKSTMYQPHAARAAVFVVAARVPAFMHTRMASTHAHAHARAALATVVGIAHEHGNLTAPPVACGVWRTCGVWRVVAIHLQCTRSDRFRYHGVISLCVLIVLVHPCGLFF